MIIITDNKDVIEIERMFDKALSTDGAHHKQWYLQQIAKMLGFDFDKCDYEKGIAP